jgi:hypothetical protein
MGAAVGIGLGGVLGWAMSGPAEGWLAGVQFAGKDAR